MSRRHFTPALRSSKTKGGTSFELPTRRTVERLRQLEQRLAAAFPDDREQIRREIDMIVVFAEFGQDVSEAIGCYEAQLRADDIARSQSERARLSASAPRRSRTTLDPDEVAAALREYVALHGTRRGHRKALARSFNCSESKIDRALGKRI